MKLKTKIFNTFVINICITLLLSSLFINILFKTTLNSFVESQRETEFNKIAEDISTITYLQNGPITSPTLRLYAKNQSININIYDNNNNLQAEFYGIKNMDYEDSNYITKKFSLVDKSNNKYGYIEIGYMENTYLYNKSISLFYNKTIKYYGFALIISLVFGFVISLLFSKKITDPIMEINKATKKIRSGEYDVKIKEYNIYEIEELSNNLTYLSNTLKLQEELRSNYAEDIAHELRTPLTNLQLHLEGIKDDVIELDDQIVLLLINEVKRLNNMVDSLQNTFNDSSKMLEPDFENFNLAEEILSVSNSFRPAMDDKNIKLHLDLDNDIEIYSDKDKLHHVLNNLISNAIKAIDQDGNVNIITKHYHNRIVMTIQDDGVGIPEKDIPHIFDRFYRVDSARNSSAGGHGLGLTITKTYLDLMEANITVHSMPNKGTEFTITFKKS